ncbi:MAG: class I poly(R)-hydroxyalkanoic acid synthase [Legionella sp.]|nr:MAG: class I poly(R)-hydroxyalkanoic acid synthase [Legionella sp.]
MTFESVIREILQKSTNVLARFEFNLDEVLPFIEKTHPVFSDAYAFSNYILNNPHHMTHYYAAYQQEARVLLQQQHDYWLGIDGVPPSMDSQRFKAEEWTQHPFFLFISQHYLLFKQHILALIQHMDHPDSHLTTRIQFLMQHYMAAMSPENFLLTNPQVLSETLQTGGLNLLQGLRNFLHDLEEGVKPGRIPLADRHAFKVGENIAITPGKVIYRNDLIELIQYEPQTKEVKSIPLLMVPPWINKYYILDLSPTNSLVKWLVEQGITVFMVSWRNPDKSHANLGLAEYLNLGPIAAIECIQTQLQVSSVSVLGFCIGGTLVSMLLAYYKARHNDVISSATFLASLIDFSDPGDIGVFIHEQQIQAIEQRMQLQGYLEGDVMATAFNALRPTDLIWSAFTRQYVQGQMPAAFDLLFWNMDTTNMPAKMHSEYLRWMYLANDLIKPGCIVVNDTPLDVHAIDCPAFFVSTKKDHIAPWQSVYRGFQLMKGQKTFVLGGSGHIAGIVIPPGKEKYGYYTNPVDAETPEAWFDAAQTHTGSWWPAWLPWLEHHSGPQLLASQRAALPAIDNAPGTYVHKRS